MNQKLYSKVEIIFYIFVAIIIAALTLDTLLLFEKLYVHRVRMDDSRLIKANIMPWVDGTFKLSDLWNDHHPAPFAGIMYILSYELESLNFRLWKVFIGFAILLQVIAFSWLAWKDQLLPNRARLLLILVVFLVLMNGNASIRYEWNLLGISHFYYALAVPLLLSLMKLERQVTWKAICLFTFFALINLIVFRSLALFWLVSALGVVFLRSFLLKFKDKNLSLIVLGCVIVAFLIEKSLFGLFDIKLNANSIDSADIMAAAKIWGADPVNTISYIITALATGLVNPGYMVKTGLSVSTVNISWVSIGILYVIAMLVAICRIRNSQYIVPLIIMGFCTLTIIAAMIIRVGPNHIGMYTSYWPRYIAMRDIGFIGVGWVAILEFQKAQRFQLAFKYLVTPIVIAGLSTLAFFYHSYDHEKSQYVRANDNQEQKAMIFIGHYLEQNDKATFQELRQSYRDQESARMPAYFVKKIHPQHHRHNNIDLIGIYFLKQNSSNVFSDNFPVSD